MHGLAARGAAPEYFVQFRLHFWFSAWTCVKKKQNIYDRRLTKDLGSPARSQAFSKDPRGSPPPRGPRAVQNRVKLSFLSAAFDPQEIVQRSQSYEGFMPIFGSDGQLEYAYFSGFTHFY